MIAHKYFLDNAGTLGAKNIRWVARQGLTPGWDIEYEDGAGELIAVEVKGCAGPRRGASDRRRSPPLRSPPGDSARACARARRAKSSVHIPQDRISSPGTITTRSWGGVVALVEAQGHTRAQQSDRVESGVHGRRWKLRIGRS